MLVLVTIFFFLPIFVASTISFHDPVGYLDNLDSINLHTLERLYPISGNVSVVVLPQSVTNVKGGEVSAVKQYASEFFANSTDRGLVIGIFTSSSQISIFDPVSPFVASYCEFEEKQYSQQYFHITYGILFVLLFQNFWCYYMRPWL